MKATGQPTGHQPATPDNQPADRPAYMDSTEAAQVLGISLDALRKRIARGTIEATKEGGHWYVQGPDNQPVNQPVNQPAADRPPTGHQAYAAEGQVDGAELAIAAMEARIKSLENQLATKDHQLTEMLIVVRQSQAMLQAAPTRRWWKIWK